MLSQVHRFIRKVLKMSSSCWNPAISSSQSTVLLRFRSRAPLKKLRNLNLSLRGGHWRFYSSLMGLVWLTLVSRCSRKLNGRRSVRQQLDKALWGCLLDVRRFWRRGRCLCLDWLLWLIYSNHLQGLVLRHLCCWTLHTTNWTTLEEELLLS